MNKAITWIKEDGFYVEGEINFVGSVVGQIISVDIRTSEVINNGDVSIIDYETSGVSKSGMSINILKTERVSSYNPSSKNWIIKVDLSVSVATVEDRCSLNNITLKIKDKTVTYDLDIGFVRVSGLNLNDMYFTFGRVIDADYLDGAWILGNSGQYTGGLFTLKSIYTFLDKIVLSEQAEIKFTDLLSGDILAESRPSCSIDFFIGQASNYSVRFDVGGRIKATFDNTYIGTIVLEVEDYQGQLYSLLQTVYFV